MAYFDDLSRYAYATNDYRDTARNVGWLEPGHDFAIEPSSEWFLDALWGYCRIIVNPTRGLHYCDLCNRRSAVFSRGDQRLILGAGEIRVFSGDGKNFAAPNLIYHYVAEHNYRPPADFLKAVEKGPRPSSDEYTLLLKATRATWRDNPNVVDESEPVMVRFVKTATGVKRVEVGEEGDE